MSAVRSLVASGVVFGVLLVGSGDGVGAPTTHTVQLLMSRFIPDSLQIRQGDTVHWVWDMDFHNVESGVVEGFKAIPDGRFRSGDPELEAAPFDLTFDRAFLDANPSPDSGYPYYCIVHYFEGMTALIEVVVLGDADRDTDVDADDHPRVVECLAGPDVEPPFDCLPNELLRIDADSDGDVDLHDVAAFQLGFTG